MAKTAEANKEPESADKSPSALPAIITVDTKSKNALAEEEGQTKYSDTPSQAQTPKHANKVKGSDTKGKPASTKGPYSSFSGGMQVSPGGSGNRFFPSHAFNNNAHPGARFSGSFDQRYPAAEFPSYEHGSFPRKQHIPMFPARAYPPNEFQARQQGWGPPPSFVAGGHVPMHRAEGHPGSGSANTVSRAVSSSFDRSVKSSSEKGLLPGQAHHEDNLTEDTTWKLLNQVHSIDEEEIQKRLNTRSQNRSESRQPASNSSSLTNTPTEGIGKKASGPDAKLQSSLDSLSSVASTQEPMELAKDDIRNGDINPSASSESLDLMKCPSGGSNLLLPSHQRSLSQLSFPSDSKRDHDEVRGDVETPATDSSEARKPPSKRSRVEGRDRRKGSPLSIECSPPNSPKGKGAKVHHPQAMYPRRANTQSPGFYDQPPTYSYSTESGMPSKPRPRSASSASVGDPPGVSQIPSWDIHPQDSFGGGSVSGGQGIMSSFSFPHDSLGIPNAYGSETVGASGRGVEQTLESRNQSFDGGPYGAIARSDSMMSYERQSYEARAGPAMGPSGGNYPMQFPPHAPSWGSASSFPQGVVYGARPGYPMMARNYSEDSGRGSPVGGRVLPPSFQPPPEFRAPPSMVNKVVPKSTIITSPYQPSPKKGPFGWTKEEDARLTEIMKKYKNAREWGPIAAEHGRGRSAKECHERWIRYLKPGVRKGQWTDAEDAIVMEVVTKSKEQPFTRWSDLAQKLPGRVGKQIRDRWVNHLNPAINHLPFSKDDDMLLWNGHTQLGKKWVEIATKFFNSTRSENHIKNRWYSASFKKFIMNEFGAEAYAGVKGKPKKIPMEKKRKSTSPRRRGGIDKDADSASRVEAV